MVSTLLCTLFMLHYQVGDSCCLAFHPLELFVKVFTHKQVLWPNSERPMSTNRRRHFVQFNLRSVQLSFVSDG